MRLDQLQELVASSRVTDWEKLEVGPLYREGYTVWSGSDGDGMSARWHDEAAVYRHDIDLTVQWGMDQYSEDRVQRYEWSKGLVNNELRSFFFDVFWRGVLVDRHVLGYFNGNHSLVPMPHSSPLDHHYPTVTRREVAIAELVAALSGGGADPVTSSLAVGDIRIDD